MGLRKEIIIGLVFDAAGSNLVVDHNKPCEQREELVTRADVFLKAHRKGPDGPSDLWAKQTIALQTLETGSTTKPIDHDTLFLNAAGRMNRGRIYGIRS